MSLIIKPFAVVVQGFAPITYYASSRGKALSQAWRCYCVYQGISFGRFLRIARAYRCAGSREFGKKITVSGLPAFLVSRSDEHSCVQFVRPDSDQVLLSHSINVREDVA